MGTIHPAADSLIQQPVILPTGDGPCSLHLSLNILVEADIQKGVVKFGLLDDGQ